MERYGLTRSMSAKGCSPDNAAAEGFFGRMKTESVYPEHWEKRTRDEVLVLIDEYIHWYNCAGMSALTILSSSCTNTTVTNSFSGEVPSACAIGVAHVIAQTKVMIAARYFLTNTSLCRFPLQDGIAWWEYGWEDIADHPQSLRDSPVSGSQFTPPLAGLSSVARLGVVSRRSTGTRSGLLRGGSGVVSRLVS